MTVQGHPAVFLVLAAAFAGVGAWLFVWSRSQSRLIRRFAESKGLVYRPGDDEGLAERVNECVALDEPKLTRSFSEFGDLVTLGRATLFRAVELLDLMPYGRAEYVNKPRVAVWFRYPFEHSGIFSVSPAFEIHQRYPESPVRIDPVRTGLQAVRVAPPPCLLSVTFMRGQVVAYLEPALTGAVSSRHLEYLVDFARALAR